MRRSCGIQMIVLGIVGGLLLVANAHTQAEDKPAGGQGALEAAAPQPGFRPKPLEGTVPENLFIGSVYSDPVPRGIPGREPNTAAE